MDRLTALIVVDAACSDDRIRHYISSVPAAGVHLSVLVVGAAPSLPMWAYGSAPYGPIIFPENWHETYQAGGTEVADRADAIEKLLQAAGVAGDVTSAYGEASVLDEQVAARAALCDVVLIDPALSATALTFQQTLEGVLFKTPVGVALNAKGVDALLQAKRPMIAWDGSLPAIRALHRALPILRQAEQVTVLVVDPNPHGPEGQNPGSDVATWLTRHGCAVTVQQSPSAGQDIGTCILARASEIGADLIVMGAYVRSRARQRILGGTTQIIVGQSDHTVLLAH
ncbi:MULTISPECIES: universal stress protein [unclassified Yoonia]|uniref:universal stress protein n=1 Tax=unclassified Yoonia TaxID=2629118 RepID=UPI002AFFD905|nr:MULTISPECIES: universal stress protein [unclassified Yoonia]